MTSTITVQIRTVYGRETVYPACPASVRFAEIAGTKTLCERTLRLIEELGFEIKIEAPRILRAA